MEQNKHWHYHPALPLKTTTPFDQPFKWQNIWQWFKASWLGKSPLPIWLALAVVNWLLLHPSQEEMQTLQASWILRIAFWNAVTLVVIAGGLQLYFHTLKKQGQQLKYEARPQAQNNPRFMFRDQVKDNIFWTMSSGLFFWTAFQSLYFWAWANGYAPWASFIENPIWCVIWLPLISLWSSFHFYWIHRWLHWPPLFKRVHSLHHRMTNVGPWSGIAMHPIEHLMYFSSVLIHFIVPSSPVHVLYHFYLEALNPAVSHNGYGGLEVKGKVVFNSPTG